ncbi:MAG: HD-GYP domain-containing protein [Nitrospirae bacterium]|nr:HD-GYP domain-containing protein [Nitrospirota bacterium]
MKEFLNNLHILIKTALIHDRSNIAISTYLTKTMESISIIMEGRESFSLRLIHDNLFIDDTRVKVDIGNFLAVMYLTEEMKKKNIGAITFHYDLSPDELKGFIYAFISTSPSPLPSPLRGEGRGGLAGETYEDIFHKLSSTSVHNITIDMLKEETEAFGHELKNTQEMAKDIYFKTLAIVSEIMESTKLKNAAHMSKAKRLIQSLVDLMLQDESTVLGLTTLKAYDEYTYNHSVNVSILSIAMGQRLGYSRRELSDLGMATLFHDIGKIDMPIDLLNKPSDFTAEEWQMIRKHPVYGVRTLLKLRGLQERAIKMVMVSFEHHLNYDLSGYPKLLSPRRISLFGRIASITDCYDALTSSRVYNRTPFIPDRALFFMMKKSGTAFDPIMLKIFINVVGIYPVGTLVLLNTNELGLVVKASANPHTIQRPVIKLISDSQGNEIDGDTIDLSYRKDISIKHSIDHRKYGVDVSRYFI